VKRLALLIDNYLNFVEPPVVEAFLASLAATETDAILFGGDTCEARMTQDNVATETRRFSHGLNTD
jgi:hypothetical protein